MIYPFDILFSIRLQSVFYIYSVLRKKGFFVILYYFNQLYVIYFINKNEYISNRISRVIEVFLESFATEKCPDERQAFRLLY